MSYTKIAAIFADSETLSGQTVTVGGWVRTIRDMKTFGFIELNDGSCFKNLQIVMDAGVLDNVGQLFMVMSEKYRADGDAEKASEYHEKALDALKKANELKPDQISSAYYLAKLLHEDGDDARARELLDHVLKIPFSFMMQISRDEAEALRKAGFVDEEILMLRSTTDREVLERLVDLNVVCTISSVDTGLALNAVAENRSTVAEAHIQVDTGMGFGGFLVGEPEKILLAYRSLPNVALSGIYTQLHTSPSGKGQEVDAQLKQFHQVLDAIHAAGFETGLVHAAGSYALMHFDAARLDAVRAGSVLLGRCRRTQGDGLTVVGYGEAPLAEVRWLPKGHTVGSDKLVTLKKPTRVAVLPVGYQNGFGVERPRASGFWSLWKLWRQSRQRTVRIGNQRARIIGSIGATETILNVTDVKCSAGDVATFDLDPLYARGVHIEYR